MSTPFYDLASLVVVPSGYKASKVYAQKPLTTDGQLTFSRASTATRVNASGLIETVASNVPRLDYTNSTCPKLLLEPQRTNLAQYSEQFDSGYFSKVNTAINANALISPDGSTNADKFIATATTGVHYLSVPVTSGSPAVLSVFAKAAEETVFAIGNATGSAGVVFDLSNGTITSGTDATIENYGNGWYRCSYLRTSWSDFQYFSLRGNVPSYTGNGIDGIYLYGVQFEVGAYATSYIPTTSAAVTRLADAAYKDGIGSFFGTNVGSFFVEAEGPFFDTTAAYLFDLSDNSSASANRFAMYSVTSNAMSLFTNGGTNFTASVTARKKIALIWNGTNAKVYLNGAKVVDITIANANPTSINLNSRFNDIEYGNSKFSQVMAFKTALTEAQAIEITTL